jgi:hypothetical protein
MSFPLYTIKSGLNKGAQTSVAEPDGGAATFCWGWSQSFLGSAPEPGIYLSSYKMLQKP